MIQQIIDTVFSINGSNEGQIMQGQGQSTVGDILTHYPLIDKKDPQRFVGDKRGKASNIVILRGHMVDGNFSPIDLSGYAKERR